MGRTNKIIDGWDNLGSAKGADNSLLLCFVFKSTGSKGEKWMKFPVKNSVRPCKTVHPVIPIKAD